MTKKKKTHCNNKNIKTFVDSKGGITNNFNLGLV